MIPEKGLTRAVFPDLQQRIFYAVRIADITAFVTPVVEHRVDPTTHRTTTDALPQTV